MKIKGWFIYSAIFLAIFGVLFVLIPAFSLSLFAITLDNVGLMMVRLFGAALMGLAVISWMVRNETASNARQAVVVGQCLESAIAFVVLLIGRLGSIGNALGWIPTLLHLSVALGFGYFLVMKRE
jgi:hypothetical protein